MCVCVWVGGWVRALVHSHLEQSCELAVPIVDILSFRARAEGVDTVPEGQQGSVDVSALNHSLPAVLSTASTAASLS